MSETNTTVAAEAVKLTREQKLVAKLNTIAARINKDTEAYNAAKAELDSIAALAAVGAGSKVQVKLGRKFADKDTTRVVDAVVLAVKEDEDGSKQYKVQYGEGFDAEIAVVTAAAISIPAAAEGVVSAE